MKRLVYIVIKRVVFGVGKVFNAEKALRLCNSSCRQRCLFALFIDDVILRNVVVVALCVHLLYDLCAQATDKSVGFFIYIVRLLAHTGNDERCSCLVYENRVHLVDNGKIQLALNKPAVTYCHIVTEVVKAEFRVRSVCYVCRIRLLLFLGALPLKDEPR